MVEVDPVMSSILEQQIRFMEIKNDPGDTDQNKLRFLSTTSHKYTYGKILCTIDIKTHNRMTMSAHVN